MISYFFFAEMVVALEGQIGEAGRLVWKLCGAGRRGAALDQSFTPGLQ
jgi:hypothetical protein